MLPRSIGDAELLRLQKHWARASKACQARGAPGWVLLCTQAVAAYNCKTGQLAAASAGGQPAGGGAPADLLHGRRPWAAQLAAALAAVGMPVDLQGPRPLCLASLRRAALGRHLQEVSAAAARQLQARPLP